MNMTMFDLSDYMNITIFDLIEFIFNNSFFSFIFGIIIGLLIVLVPYSLVEQR